MSACLRERNRLPVSPEPSEILRTAWSPYKATVVGKSEASNIFHTHGHSDISKWYNSDGSVGGEQLIFAKTLQYSIFFKISATSQFSFPL